MKFVIFIVFLFAAVLAAGVFGMIHDQISYSVSSEYFTKFKFIQFHMQDPHVAERLRASKIGFLASWWMGIPLGVLCGFAGFVQRSPAMMAKALGWSLLIIAAFTLTFALGGLAYGWHRTQTLDLANYKGWFIPAGIKDLRRFLCAGYMHNSAYLGAALSIPVAWIFHYIYRAKTRSLIPVRSSEAPAASRRSR